MNLNTMQLNLKQTVKTGDTEKISQAEKQIMSTIHAINNGTIKQGD